MSRGSAGEYQADEQAVVPRLRWRVSGRLAGRCRAATLVSIRQMSRQVLRGSAGEYQAVAGLPSLAEFFCGSRLLSCCVDSLSHEARKPPGSASPPGGALAPSHPLLTPTVSFRPIRQRTLMPGAKNAGETRGGHPVRPTQPPHHGGSTQKAGQCWACPLAHPEIPREPLLASLCKSSPIKRFPTLGQSRTCSKSKPD